MVPFRHSLIFLAVLGLLAACDNSADSGNQTQAPSPAATTPTEPAEPEAAADTAPAENSEPADSEQADNSVAFSVTEVTQFDAPWAMTFLPDGRLLVTAMAGTLRLHDLASGNTGTISGVP